MVEKVAPQEPSSLDETPIPPRWRSYVPVWFRRLVWVDGASAYDAFLSYSWRSDSDIAPILQSTLQKFLCPWYQVRAKTIFRDLSYLPAGALLDEELQRRMSRSKCLIVLASPAAAASNGVEKEAAFWSKARRQDEVVVVVTAGKSAAWADVRANLLPQSFRDWLSDEPVLVDLRAEVEAARAHRDDPSVRGRMVEALKQLLLRLHPGSTWELLRGEERRQRRLALTSIAATLLVLSAALLATATAAHVALQQAAEARNQRSVAEQATKSAIDDRRKATENELAAREALQRALESDKAKMIAIDAQKNSDRIAELHSQVAEDQRLKAEESAREALRAANAASDEAAKNAISTGESKARALTLASRETLSADPQRALLLALYAGATTLRSEHSVLPETVMALRAAGALTSMKIDVALPNDLSKVAFDPTLTRVVVVTTAGRLQIIDLRSEKRDDVSEAPFITGANNWIAMLSAQLIWSTDGQHIGYADTLPSSSAFVFDTATKQLSQPRITGRLAKASWNHNVRRLATVAWSNGSVISIWDANTGQWIARHENKAAPTFSQWSADDAAIVTEDVQRFGDEVRGKVFVRDVEATRNKLTLDVSFFPNWFGAVSIAGAEPRSRIRILDFDGDNSRNVRSVDIETTAAGINRGGAWSPDGRYLAVTGWDKVSVIDRVTAREVFVVPTSAFANLAGEESVMWSPDGSSLGVQNRSVAKVFRTAYLYAQEPKALMQILRAHLRVSLSADDCRRYFGDPECPSLVID